MVCLLICRLEILFLMPYMIVGFACRLYTPTQVLVIMGDVFCDDDGIRGPPRWRMRPRNPRFLFNHDSLRMYLKWLSISIPLGSPPLFPLLPFRVRESDFPFCRGIQRIRYRYSMRDCWYNGPRINSISIAVHLECIRPAQSSKRWYPKLKMTRKTDAFLIAYKFLAKWTTRPGWERQKLSPSRGPCGGRSPTSPPEIFRGQP